MNLITPVILIITSFVIFFGYVDPNYRGDNLGGDRRSIQSLQLEDAEYQKALNNSTAIRSTRQSLVDKKGTFSADDLARLQELLPDNIDNIKLVIDIKQIAENHTLTLKNIKLNMASDKSDSAKLGQSTAKYGTVGLSFSVNSSYENFQNFMADLEKSLRLVDVVDLAVTGNDTGIYEFSIGLKTYWLK